MRKIGLFCAGPVAFCVAAHFIVPTPVDHARNARHLLTLHKARVPPDGPIAARMDAVSPTNWHYHRTPIYVLGGNGELGYGLGYPESRHFDIQIDGLRGLIEDTPSSTRVTVVVDKDYYERWRDRLADYDFIDSDEGFVFLQFRGRKNGADQPAGG